MPRLSQAAFDAGQQFVARRAFLAGGVSFGPGAPFPVTDPRLARRLYEMRLIQVAPGAPSAPRRAAADYRIVRRTLGWYDVIAPDGSRVNEGALRHPEAEALAASVAQKDH